MPLTPEQSDRLMVAAWLAALFGILVLCRTVSPTAVLGTIVSAIAVFGLVAWWRGRAG